MRIANLLALQVLCVCLHLFLYIDVEVFDRFKDGKGNFEPNLCKDMKGMLQLYEASYLQTENESTLESAREFTTIHLQKSLEEKGSILDQQLALLVQHALELPLHWRALRVEARWFIDLYEKRANHNAILLELAKLDFNIVQATHQKDLKYSSRFDSNLLDFDLQYLVLQKNFVSENWDRSVCLIQFDFNINTGGGRVHVWEESWISQGTDW